MPTNPSTNYAIVLKHNDEPHKKMTEASTSQSGPTNSGRGRGRGRGGRARGGRGRGRGGGGRDSQDAPKDQVPVVSPPDASTSTTGSHGQVAPTTVVEPASSSASPSPVFPGGRGGGRGRARGSGRGGNRNAGKKPNASSGDNEKSNKDPKPRNPQTSEPDNLDQQDTKPTQASKKENDTKKDDVNDQNKNNNNKKKNNPKKPAKKPSESKTDDTNKADSKKNEKKKQTNTGKNQGGKNNQKGDSKTKTQPSKTTSNTIPPNQPQQTSDINYGRGQKITVFHVAEKPSIAQAIANGLSRGNTNCKKKTLPVHEFMDPPFPKAPHASGVLHKISSVAGHVFSVDFPQKFQSWESVDPLELFQAPIVRKPCKGSVVKHLQDEAKGCDFIVLWMDCDR